MTVSTTLKNTQIVWSPGQGDTFTLQLEITVPEQLITYPLAEILMSHQFCSLTVFVMYLQAWLLAVDQICMDPVSSSPHSILCDTESSTRVCV